MPHFMQSRVYLSHPCSAKADSLCLKLKRVFEVPSGVYRTGILTDSDVPSHSPRMVYSKSDSECCILYTVHNCKKEDLGK